MEIQQTLNDWMTAFPGARLDLLGRLLLAAVLGGLIGMEREYSGKPAGLRTNMLICIGAALLGDVSIHFAGLVPTDLARPDPGRIAAQVVSGIGFLGAGTIIQSRGSVTGLTTAATLWVVAAIGLAVGGGAYVAGVGATVLVLIALVPLGMVERLVEMRHSSQLIRVVVGYREGVIEEIEDVLEGVGLDADTEQVSRDLEDEVLIMFIRVAGSKEQVRHARRVLVETEGVQKVVLESLSS